MSVNSASDYAKLLAELYCGKTDDTVHFYYMPGPDSLSPFLSIEKIKKVYIGSADARRIGYKISLTVFRHVSEKNEELINDALAKTEDIVDLIIKHIENDVRRKSAFFRSLTDDISADIIENAAYLHYGWLLTFTVII